MRKATCHAGSLRGLALALILLAGLGAAPSEADPLALIVQAPSQVVAQQPFSIRVTVPDARDGGNATLSLLDENARGLAPVVLAGSLQARVEHGEAFFPAVLVQGDPGAERTVRLVAAVVDGSRSISGVSEVILVRVPPTPVLQDRVFGGIGVEVSLDHGHLVVDSVHEALPASKAGVRAGDRIVAIDSRPVDVSSLEAATGGLKGPVGTRVVVTVQHRGSSQSQELDLERAAIKASPVSFHHIPSQVNGGLFQVTVEVVDDAGRPLPGANVSVRLDPAYARTHFLVFSTAVDLLDGSRALVQELTGVTGPDGKIALWLRLGSNATPYKSRLAATVEWGQRSVGPIQSNVFTVYSHSD